MGNVKLTASKDAVDNRQAWGAEETGWRYASHFHHNAQVQMEM